MGNYVVLQQQKRTVNRFLWFGETETELKMTVKMCGGKRTLHFLFRSIGKVHRFVW